MSPRRTQRGASLSGDFGRSGDAGTPGSLLRKLHGGEDWPGKPYSVPPCAPWSRAVAFRPLRALVSRRRPSGFGGRAWWLDLGEGRFRLCGAWGASRSMFCETKPFRGHRPEERVVSVGARPAVPSSCYRCARARQAVPLHRRPRRQTLPEGPRRGRGSGGMLILSMECVSVGDRNMNRRERRERRSIHHEVCPPVAGKLRGEMGPF